MRPSSEVECLCISPGFRALSNIVLDKVGITRVSLALRHLPGISPWLDDLGREFTLFLEGRSIIRVKGIQTALFSLLPLETTRSQSSPARRVHLPIIWVEIIQLGPTWFRNPIVPPY